MFMINFLLTVVFNISNLVNSLVFIVIVGIKLKASGWTIKFRAPCEVMVKTLTVRCMNIELAVAAGQCSYKKKLIYIPRLKDVDSIAEFLHVIIHEFAHALKKYKLFDMVEELVANTIAVTIVQGIKLDNDAVITAMKDLLKRKHPRVTTNKLHIEVAKLVIERCKGRTPLSILFL